MTMGIRLREVLTKSFISQLTCILQDCLKYLHQYPRMLVWKDVVYIYSVSQYTSLAAAY